MPTQVEGPPTAICGFESGLDPDACLKGTGEKIAGGNLGDESLRAEIATLGTVAFAPLVEGMPVVLTCRRIVAGASCPYSMRVANKNRGQGGAGDATAETIEVTPQNERCIRETETK